MQRDNHEIHRPRQVVDLTRQPPCLIAFRQQRRPAVQRDHVNARTDLRRIPAPVAQFRKRVPPIVQVGYSVFPSPFVIAQSGKHTQMRIPPSFGFRLKHGVIGGDIPRQRHVAIHNQRRGVFRSYLLYQPLANHRVGLTSVGLVCETLIAVSNHAERRRQLSVRDCEGRPWLAEQLIRWQREGGCVLCQ
jgi:hypothetical protein